MGVHSRGKQSLRCDKTSLSKYFGVSITGPKSLSAVAEECFGESLRGKLPGPGTD